MIKNVDKNLNVEICKTGSYKMRIEIKTKKMFDRIFRDSFVLSNLDLYYIKSYGGSNKWIFMMEKINQDVIDDLKRIGATITDKR